MFPSPLIFRNRTALRGPLVQNPAVRIRLRSSGVWSNGNVITTCPARHQHVLLGIHVNAGEVRDDGGFDLILGREVVERNWVQPQINLEEAENVDGRLIFAENGILLPQRRDLFPYMLHVVEDAAGLDFVGCMELLDVLEKLVELRF